MVPHGFLRTVVSLLLVYLVEDQNTCVELHILITHLHRGESGVWEVSGTGVWVELPRWSFPVSRGSGARHEEPSPGLSRGHSSRVHAGSRALRARGAQWHSEWRRRARRRPACYRGRRYGGFRGGGGATPGPRDRGPGPPPAPH